MIKLRILRWRYDPELSTWAQCNYEGGKDRVVEGDVTTEAEDRMMPKEGLALVAGTCKEVDSSLKPPERTLP